MGRLIDAEAADLQCELFTYTRYTGIDEAPYEDATKAIDEAPTVEAIPKADYENRLKADLVAMLTEIQLEIEECVDGAEGSPQFEQGVTIARVQVVEIIQQKINELKGESGDEE